MHSAVNTTDHVDNIVLTMLLVLQTVLIILCTMLSVLQTVLIVLCTISVLQKGLIVLQAILQRVLIVLQAMLSIQHTDCADCTMHNAVSTTLRNSILVVLFRMLSILCTEFSTTDKQC